MVKSAETELIMETRDRMPARIFWNCCWRRRWPSPSNWLS